MQHTIPVESLGPLGQVMAEAVTTCVHCGFCLPACPTYTVLGEEMDSPRGRIVLMKSVLEGGVDLDEAMPYIDRCLGCLGCVTACPSGVPYDELITPFRGYAETKRQHPAQGTRRPRGALLSGCVQQALAPEINWATLRVLARNGVEVVIPPGQGCCGALASHTGDQVTARSLASELSQVFSADVDAILTNAAGCGSSMHEYPLLFRGTDLGEVTEAFARKIMDISVFLDQLGITSPPPLPSPLKAAYHDACHLAHAQGVTAAPRRLLGQIPELTIVPLPEGDLCCGSAGSYNLEQPEIADLLGVRKAKNILATKAEVNITGNIGCLLQLRPHLKRFVDLNGGQLEPPPVLHMIE